MPKINDRLVEDLKANGHYYAAGALARSLGHGRFFGCHYGMRSEKERSQELFYAGYDALGRVDQPTDQELRLRLSRVDG